MKTTDTSSLPEASRNSQNGSALLLTLGILSLILIMGMSFTFSARANRLIAKTNADQIQARLLAESSLNRILGMLSLASRGDNTYLPLAYTPAANGGTGHAPFLWKEITGPDGAWQHLYLSQNENDTNAAISTEIQNLLNNATTRKYLPIIGSIASVNSAWANNAAFIPFLDDTNTVIGRMAFLVLDESNKLNLNQMHLQSKSPKPPFLLYNAEGTNIITEKIVKNATDPSNAIFFYDLNGNNSFSTVDEYNTCRNGQSLQELEIPQELYPKERYNSIANGQNLSNNTTYLPWFSYYHLHQKGGSVTDQNWTYTFFSGKDYNAWQRDIPGSAYQKFDLSGTSWIPDLDPAAPGLYSLNEGKLQAQNDKTGWSTDGSVTGIEHGRYLVGKLSRDAQLPLFSANPANLDEIVIPYFHDVLEAEETNLGLQVAANLVDFSDNDSIITISETDINGGTLDAANLLNATAEPKYCGNECVPALNEFALTFGAIQFRRNGASDPLDVSQHAASFYLFLDHAELELLNIFPDTTISPNNGHCTVRVEADISIEDLLTPSGSVPTGEMDPINHKNFADFTLNPSTSESPPDTPHPWYSTRTCDIAGGASLPSLSAASKIISIADYPITHIDLSGDTTIENSENIKEKYRIHLTLKRIVLQFLDDNGNPMDFAIWKSETGETFTFSDKQFYADMGYPQYFTISLESIDPRLNHKTSNWVFHAPTEFYSERNIYPEHVTMQENQHQNKAFKARIASAPNQDNEPDGVNLLNDSMSPMPTFSTAYIPNRPVRDFWELGAIHRGQTFRTLDFTGVRETDDSALLDQVKITPLQYRNDYWNPNTLNEPALRKILEHIPLTENSSETWYSKTDSITSSVSSGVSLPNLITEAKERGSCSTFNDLTPVFQRITEACRGDYSAVSDRMREALIGRTGAMLSFNTQTYTILIAAQPLSCLNDAMQDASSEQWSKLKKTIANPIEYTTSYTGTAVTKRYSRLATQYLIAHVSYNTVTNAFTVLQVHYLEE